MRWFSSIVTRLTRRALRRLHVHRLYDIEWARAFLLESNVGALVVDWGDVDRFIYRPISSAANELHITKVGVPHGMKLFLDENWTTRQVNEAPTNWAEAYGWMTDLVVESENSRERYSLPGYGFDAERMHVLGSARFCEEWQEVYESLVPRRLSRTQSSRLKVLYFDHTGAFRINTDEISEYCGQRST